MNHDIFVRYTDDGKRQQRFCATSVDANGVYLEGGVCSDECFDVRIRNSLIMLFTIMICNYFNFGHR